MINIIKNFTKSSLVLIISFLKSNLSGFMNFILDKRVMQIGFSILISSQLQILTRSIIELLVNPIVNRITMGTIKTIEEWEINMFNIHIKIGRLISNIINFVLILIVIYYMWKYSDITNIKRLIDGLDNIKNKLN
jgi:large-conductance mechanosensitive channel